MNNFCKKCGTKNSGNNFCTKCGHQFSFQPQTNFQHQINKRSNAWYLLPIVFGLTTVIFGIVGGIIAYFVLKNSDPKKAKNCLIIGIIFAILGLLLIYLGFFNSLDFSSPLDNDVFDGLSDIEKSVRQTQLQQCENNMGYLQSYELGQMIEERCVNGILSSIEERKFSTTP